MKPLIAYLIIINAVGFFLMLTDKQKARRKQWRISEATLLTTALLGGSIGVLTAMQMFHHKTKHPPFSIGVPLILVLQILFFLFLIPNMQ